MMRFLTLGLADIESRLSRFFRGGRTDDAVAALVSSSRIVQGIDRVLLTALAAIAASSTYRVADRMRSVWRALPQSRQYSLVGASLVAAAAANIGMTVVFQSVPGWLWAVMPVLAGVIGVIMIAADREGQR